MESFLHPSLSVVFCFRTPDMALLVWALAALLCHAAAEFESQTCNLDRMATIQVGAEAIIGGIIGVHAPGTNGYGCGVPKGSKSTFSLPCGFSIFVALFS